MYIRILPILLALLCSGGCTDGDGKSLLRLRRAGGPAAANTPSPDTATIYGAAPEQPPITSAELEAGRMDASWKQFVALDTAAARPPAPPAESLEDITPGRVNTGAMTLPLGGDVAGPSVLRVQILLDRVHFAPGVMDGRWGKNTEKAVYWLQRREGLPATGQVDSVTYGRLRSLAGEPDSVVVRYRLAANDVEGPFVDLPADIYERAKLRRLSYESLSEKLAEQFHTTPALLARLNPEVALDSLRAGEAIYVPALPAADTTSAAVARLVVSDGGYYLHALDAGGRILFHFPSTLGSRYEPSPTGDFEVVAVVKDPWWHYQPKLLADVPDTNREARIPPGPNNAVGSVWIGLSKPHFGIHGTSAPQTIGYASSAGCVRLTNWDALFLADRIAPGTPVQFRDVSDEPGESGVVGDVRGI